MKKKVVAGILAAGLFMGANSIMAEEVYKIAIKDHKFDPETLSIPSGKKIKIEIYNQDPTPEEFESAALNREKVISGGKKAIIFVGPLKPGSYSYFGEFHEKTARGVIVAE